jgi:hypothetical protein
LPTPSSLLARVTKKQLQIIGCAVAGLVLIAIIAGTCRGKSKETATKPGVTEPGSASPAKDPADEQVAQIEQLIEDGNARGAFEQAVAARKLFPKDARLSYLLGKLYFERQSWSLGLKQFRDTLALDPTYRSDPELIKTALKAFITPSEYPADLGAFLRNDIGAPARQYLEETAASHPRANIRARAKALLAKLP